MNIRAALSGVGQAFENYCYSSQQAGLSVVLKLKEFRNDTEQFQKICQVANYCLLLAIMHNPALSSLARFSFVLGTANMHDFYSFLKQPRQWFFPISARAINENAVLDSMSDVLYKQIHLEEVMEPEDDDLALDEEQNELGSDRKEELREIARLCLLEQLAQMDASDDAYRSIEDFKKVLQTRLNSVAFRDRLEKLIEDDHYEYDFSSFSLEDLANVKLDALEVSLRHTPFIEKLTDYTWTLVDIGCVGLYLQGWKLLDTAKWSARVGQYQGFQWMKNHHLDQWVVGLVCAAFAWKLLEATRKLQDEALTKEEKNQAKWSCITSIAEMALWGAVLLNLMGKTRIDNTYIYCFGIVAKTLGAISIAVRPKHQFFQRPEAAPAA